VFRVTCAVRGNELSERNDDIPARIKQDEVARNGKKRQEKLPRNGHQERDHQERRDGGFDQCSWFLHHGQAEDAQDYQEQVLGIVD
jgi:hypothetical protein